MNREPRYRRDRWTIGAHVLFRCAASAIGAAAVLLLMSSALSAQDYPSRPVKLLVGAPPGGATDTIAREIAAPMAAALHQPAG